MLCGVDFALGPSYDVVLPVNDVNSNRRKLLREYSPRLVLSYPSAAREDVANALKENADKILVCTLRECLPPFNSVTEVLETIKKRDVV